MKRWFLVGLMMVMASGAQAQTIKRVRKPFLRPNAYKGVRFFPALKWRVTVGMGANTTPALADLDLDGTMDIVLPDAQGSLFRLTDQGNVLWRVALPEAATVGVSLGDVNRDGTLDILVAAGKTLLCFTPAGKENWRVSLDEPINSFPTIADIDADGKPEVIFGANDNKLHVLTGSGKSKWTFATKSWIVGGVAVGNLVGDKKLEIVFGSLDYNVFCVDAKGKPLWKYATGNWVQTSPCIADIDRDGGKDVLIGSDDGFVYALSRRGTLKWKNHLFGVSADDDSTRTRAYLAVADLDKDGTLETVAVSPQGEVHVFTSDGQLAWRKSAGGYESTSVVGAPLIADLNGDGWQDILLATEAGNLVAMDAWGNTHWSHRAARGLVSTPIVADLDRDKKLEIYAANKLESGLGFFSQYEMSVAGGAMAWPALKGDPYRTGEVSNAADYGANLRRGGDYATAWEPFAAGYRPRTGVQPPRRLRITTLPLNDISGNHDGALDPGETALMKVRVENFGRGASYDSLLRVSFQRSPLRLDRTSMYLGWIAPRATKTVTFRLTAPPLPQLLSLLRQQNGLERDSGFRDVAGGDEPLIENAVVAPVEATKRRRLAPAKITRATLAKTQVARLQVLESGVQAAVSEAKVFNMPPLPPLLRVHARRLIDSRSSLTSGNGNGRLDSGETAVLRLLLVNDNLTTAQNATATLTSNSRDVLVATPTAKLQNVVPYGGRQINMALRVAPQLSGKSVTLKLTTQAQGAPPHSELITLPVGQNGLDTSAPTVLLLSPRARIATTSAAKMTISGALSDNSGIGGFSFDGTRVPLSRLKKEGNRYRFGFSRALKIGENVFPMTATDARGNTNSLWVRIVRRPAQTPSVRRVPIQTRKTRRRS